MFTLAQVAQHPNILTDTVMTQDSDVLIVRPLEKSDAQALALFLQNLSVATRRFSTFAGYDIGMARELCEAIARYDKLRFVLETSSKQIAGLLEFSFDIVDDDIERYRLNNIELNRETDCRFGPTLADDFQNKGIGTLVMPFIRTVPLKFGQKRIILWGGVLSDNCRARRFYEKSGFKQVGKFMITDDEVIDMILEL